MKAVLSIFTLLCVGGTVSAGVNLPTETGIDGWNSDSRSAASGAFQQGYLTLSNVKNPLINPAHAIDLKNSTQLQFNGEAQPSEFETSNTHPLFGGGVYASVGSHIIGIFGGRPTDDEGYYLYDEAGDGTLNAGLDFDRDDTNPLNVPNNIVDVFWARREKFGDIGVRFNYRALSHEENGNLGNNNFTVDTMVGKAHEYNASVGYIASSKKLAVTLNAGLPTLEVKNHREGDESVLDRMEYKDTYRLGGTVKYLAYEKGNTKIMVSGFVARNFVTIEQTIGFGEDQADLTTIEFTNQYLGYGVVTSISKQYNASTRLVSSLSVNQSNLGVGRREIYGLLDETTKSQTQTTQAEVSAGLEFKRGNNTTFVGSVNTKIYDSIYFERTNGPTESQATDSNSTDNGTSPEPTAEIGLTHKFVNSVVLDLVINKRLLDDGLSEGFATSATVSYLF